MKTLMYACLLLCTACATDNPVQPQPPAAGTNTPLIHEDAEVYLRLVIRTPDQLAAFYQGRGFHQAAIDAILDTCFITPIIRNKTLDTLWLELDEWTFTDHQGKPIPRLRRDYWPAIWEQVDLPQAHRSTFGWTLLPEVRDLRLDESAGGSIVLPMQAQPLTLEARFPTGPEKSGPLKTIRIEGVVCRPAPQ